MRHRFQPVQFHPAGFRPFLQIGRLDIPGQLGALVGRHRNDPPGGQLAMIRCPHGRGDDFLDLGIARPGCHHIARPAGSAGGQIGGKAAEVVELLFGHGRHFGRDGNDCKGNWQ